MDFFGAARGEIGSIAFKNVGHVGADQVYFIGTKAMHGVPYQQGAFTFQDQRQLDLLVAVQMRVKIREDILLNQYGLVVRGGNSKR